MEHQCVWNLSCMCIEMCTRLGNSLLLVRLTSYRAGQVVWGAPKMVFYHYCKLMYRHWFTIPSGLNRRSWLVAIAETWFPCREAVIYVFLNICTVVSVISDGKNVQYSHFGQCIYHLPRSHLHLEGQSTTCTRKQNLKQYSIILCPTLLPEADQE